MIKNIGWITLWSQDYKKLANWYEEVLGFKRTGELDITNDSGIMFEFESGSSFWIGQHSEVVGKAKDRYRFFICFNVDSVSEMYKELVKKGVEFVRTPSLSPTSDYYAMTLVDLDGNLVQFESISE